LSLDVTHALNKATPATEKQSVYTKEELSGELRGDLNAWSRHELFKTNELWEHILLCFMITMND